MTNPHSPTKEWLDGIATGGNGYYVDAEPGDEGTMVFTTPTGERYEVTVERLEDEA